MDLTNEFKQKILCSKQLLDKCKIFQQYEKRFLDKGYDDFSDRVEDSIELVFIANDGKYDLNCQSSNENMEQFTYFNFFKNILEKLESDLDTRMYLTSLGFNITLTLIFVFEFEIKYWFDKNQFIFKNVKSCKISKFIEKEENKIEIFSVDSGEFDSKKIKILGYSKSEEDAKKLISFLNEEKNYLCHLRQMIKDELFEIIQIIKNPNNLKKISLLIVEDEIDIKLNKTFKKHNDDIENKIHLTKINSLLDLNISSYDELINLDIENLIETWLDKNCKKELRNLIELDKFNKYSGWFEFVRFMDEDITFDFRKI